MSEKAICPNCGGALASGFIGFYTGLWWHTQRLHGLSRLFPFALPAGEHLAGSWTSSGMVRMTEGQRCESCGTVVVAPTPKH